jgi:hypothetical protein
LFVQKKNANIWEVVLPKNKYLKGKHNLEEKEYSFSFTIAFIKD